MIDIGTGNDIDMKKSLGDMAYMTESLTRTFDTLMTNSAGCCIKCSDTM
jgi:hypothetical protein